MEVTICIGSSCHLKGSHAIINELQLLIKNNDLVDKVTLKASFCLGHCTKGVSVLIDDGKICSVTNSNVEKFFTDNILRRLSL